MENKIYYRGCPNANAVYNMVPSAYRFVETNKALAYENKILYEARNNRDRYEQFSRNTGKSESFKKGRFWGMLQHYGFPTRLLDITAKKTIAEYFACSTDFNNPGIIYTIDTKDKEYQFIKGIDSAKKIIDKMEFVEDYDKYIGKTKEKIDTERKKSNWVKNISTNVIFSYESVFNRTVKNRRCENQEGAFLIYGNKIDEKIVTGELNIIVVPGKEIPAKQKMTKLFELCNRGIDCKYIYPDSEQTIRIESVLWKLLSDKNYQLSIGDFEYINPKIKSCNEKEKAKIVKVIDLVNKADITVKEQYLPVISVEYANYCIDGGEDMKLLKNVLKIGR